MQTKPLSLLFAAGVALALSTPALATGDGPAADGGQATVVVGAVAPAPASPAPAQDALPPEAVATIERLCRPVARRGGHPTTRQKRAFRRPCHSLGTAPVSMSEIELFHQRMAIEAIEDPAY